MSIIPSSKATTLSQENGADRRPHHVNPYIASLRVILAVKNFASTPGVCHIGLGVTATNTMKVLRRFGVHVEAWSTQTAKELKSRLLKEHLASETRRAPITHVIISAPSWVQPDDFADFSFGFPETEFVQLNHSGCAYLSIDKFGIRNIREVADMQISAHNIVSAGNNPRFVDWVRGGLKSQCVLLPNLYDSQRLPSIRIRPGVVESKLFMFGCFGASRPWKNQLTAAGSIRRIGAATQCPARPSRQQ